MVGDRDGQVRPAQLAAGHAQTLERLRAGHLVHQVAVDVEDAGAVRELLHDVAVPDLVEQRAWLRIGHGVSLPVYSAVSAVPVTGTSTAPEPDVLRAFSAMRADLPERPRR